MHASLEEEGHSSDGGLYSDDLVYAKPSLLDFLSVIRAAGNKPLHQSGGDGGEGRRSRGATAWRTQKAEQ